MLTRTSQVAPAEMKEIVTAYKDKGDANGVKQVQSSGLHVAGERFVVLKADERSLYGKKVRFFFPPSFELKSVGTVRKKFLVGVIRAVLTRVSISGQGGYRHRQDHSGYPRHTLSRARATRFCGQHRRATRRLPDKRWILGVDQFEAGSRQAWEKGATEGEKTHGPVRDEWARAARRTVLHRLWKTVAANATMANVLWVEMTQQRRSRW